MSDLKGYLAPTDEAEVPAKEYVRNMSAHVSFSIGEDKMDYPTFTQLLMDLIKYAESKGLKFDSVRNNYNW